MVAHCICLLAGAYSLAFLTELPADLSFPAYGLVAAVACGVRIIRFPAVFAVGFCVMGIAAQEQLDDRLAVRVQGSTTAVSGRIVGFPQLERDSLRFLFRPIGRRDLPEKIRLTWLRPGTVPKIGEVWRMQVRLKRPRGYSNPGGFDYEGWLFREGIGATGYVVAEHHNYLVQGEPAGPVDRLRRNVVDRISTILPRDDARAVLMAIAVGARHEISRDQWDLYASTGTSHLMAISGLHVGLAAGSAYFVCWVLAAPVIGRRCLRDFALLCAVCVAGAYAVTSGFGVPARRAFLMSLVAALMLFHRRRFEPVLLLSTTLGIVFFLDPLAILTPGFKMSFAAVAILFALAKQHIVSGTADLFPVVNKLALSAKHLAFVQLALLAGLFPLTVLMFGRFTTAAPMVNLVVLPIFSVVTAPLTLAGIALDSLSPSIAEKFLLFAHQSLHLVLWIVSRFGEVAFLSFQIATQQVIWAIWVSTIYVVFPPGWPGRKLAFIAIAWVAGDRPASPPEGCFDLHTLDVGQGLAVVLQTRSKTMLFDTGPSFVNGGNTVESVVLPFLTARGITRLDRVVISHADLDHAGGISSVIADIEVGRVMVGEPIESLWLAQKRCARGDAWHWDGVDFEVVHPRKDPRWTGNNSSCVVMVAAGENRVLLTGDIESPVEKLLEYRSALSKSHAVLVPHHGSRTSSSSALVNATRPGLAVVSAAHRNRWGFPKADVVARWQQAGARVVNTATSGAISQRICRNGSGPVLENRAEAREYWHDAQPAGP